jgi:hypothetical protein
MGKIINIEIVVDAQAILDDYPEPSQDPSQPTAIARDAVYLITEYAHVSNAATHATADLAIDAEVDDVIRWRGLSLSDNVSHRIIPYRIVKLAGAEVTTSPAPIAVRSWVPIPNQNPDRSVDPLECTAQQLPVYYMGCIVTNTGTERYRVAFYITEQIKGNDTRTLGYFHWDPSVTVD